MILFLKYWQVIVAALGGALLVALLAWVLHGWSIGRLEAKQKSELAALELVLRAECAKDKQITTEASNDYQNQIADLRGQLASVKRLRPSACLPVRAAKPAGGYNGATGNGQLSRPDGGVDSDDLFDFAYDAEEVGRRLDACQGFVRQVWKAKQ